MSTQIWVTVNLDVSPHPKGGEGGKGIMVLGGTPGDTFLSILRASGELSGMSQINWTPVSADSFFMRPNHNLNG